MTFSIYAWPKGTIGNTEASPNLSERRGTTHSPRFSMSINLLKLLHNKQRVIKDDKLLL